MARKGEDSAPGGDSAGAGEFRQGSKTGTAFIDGVNFHSKAVRFVEVDGMAMFEGDIVLGTVEEVQAASHERRQMFRGEIEAGVIISGGQYRWPNCQVPYTIDPNLPNQARVTDAIAHWESRTRFRFPLRTDANAAQFPDYVTFRPGAGCSSYVGRRGGQQHITLAAGCGLGNTIHEIGHAVGLWHEHSREDRDSFVRIHWDKIQSGVEHNFNQHITDGDDVGSYDYGSIMHYPRNAFSIDGSDTITPRDPNAVIGQRTGLSAGDVAAAAALCPPMVGICPVAPNRPVCPVSPRMQICPPVAGVACPPAPRIRSCPPAPRPWCPPVTGLTCPPAPRIRFCSSGPGPTLPTRPWQPVGMSGAANAEPQGYAPAAGDFCYPAPTSCYTGPNSSSCYGGPFMQPYIPGPGSICFPGPRRGCYLTPRLQLCIPGPWRGCLAGPWMRGAGSCPAGPDPFGGAPWWTTIPVFPGMTNMDPAAGQYGGYGYDNPGQYGANYGGYDPCQCGSGGADWTSYEYPDPYAGQGYYFPQYGQSEYGSFNPEYWG